jgi:tetratricopeptide (TPR) repeat protein
VAGIPRFRLRTLMIVIGSLAMVLAASVFVLRTISGLNAALEASYGPDGVQAREKKFSDHMQAGNNALRRGDYVEAEARYRSALDLEAYRGYNGISYVLVGLADSLIAQDRDEEVEPLYRRALELREKIGTDPRSWRIEHLRIAETLEHYASFLRLQGRADVAEAMEGRAGAIRAEWE